MTILVPASMVVTGFFYRYKNKQRGKQKIWTLCYGLFLIITIILLMISVFLWLITIKPVIAPEINEFKIPSGAITYNGHTYVRGSIYDIGKYPCSFNDVEEYCEDLGGHLAVINDAGENSFLYNNFCLDGKTPVFFGFTDQEQEGNWTWVWGNSDYTNWTKEGQIHPAPDNHGSKGVEENYAEFNYGNPGANDGSWNDAAFAVNTDYYVIEWEFTVPDN